MSLNFIEKMLCIGGESSTPPTFQFYRRGFIIGAEAPTWQDIILSGTTALTLTNALADGLNYLKLFGGTEQVPTTYLDTVTLSGGCEQNGTATPTQPVDIVCNNGTIKVSPNLFNKNLVPDVNEYINRSNGNISTPSSGEFRHSDYITIKENTQYYVGIISSAATTAGLAFYDDTKTYISGISLTQLGDNNNVITSTNHTQYIRFSFRVDEGYNTDWQNTVYLVEGNQPLAEFMPYGAIYTDGTVEQVTDSLGNMANAEMLLSVGDYKDTQEVLNGNVTRNIGILVLDGTETNAWTVQSNRVFATMANIGVTNCIQPSSTISLLSTHFSEDANCRLSSLKTVLLYFDTASMNISTATDWNNWLSDQYNAGFPVIIVYPLATATTETVTGQFLSKSPVTQTAGSIDNLPITITESSHTIPTPQQPLDIVSNNGVLKYNANIIDNSITGQGTFVSPSSQATRIYKYLGKLQPGNYTLLITGGFQFIVQYRDVDPPAAGMAYGNIGTWATSGTYTLDNPDYFYGIAIRYPDNSSIIPSDFNGTIALKPQFIYTDGTTETVQVTGKNLFNKDDDTNWGGWYPAQGVIAQSTNANRTVVMRCQPNTTYYFKHCTYTGGLRAFCIEEETWGLGTPVASSGGSARGDANEVYSFTTTANAKWLFALFGRNDVYVTATFEEQASDYILSTEELTSDTPYEPYYNGGTATAEMLLKVGEYKDTQEALSGAVTRNIGIKVLDGTEGWVRQTTTTTQRFSIDLSNVVSTARRMNVPITHFYYDVSSRDAGVGFITNGRLYLYTNPDWTLEQFKQFLADQYNAGTPVIVVYPLAEATTETVTGQPLSIQEGTNIIGITEASINDLPLEVSYKASV